MHRTIAEQVAKANQFVGASSLHGIALFGPSGSGKSTYIAELKRLWPDKYTILPIVTTRPRRSENEENRVFLSEDEFLAELVNCRLCYVSHVYGYWHGMRITDFNLMSDRNETIIFDPNQFSRLEILNRIFVNGTLNVVCFLPEMLDTLRQYSDEKIWDLFCERIRGRGQTDSVELKMRVDEAVQTIRQCQSMNLDNYKIFVNRFNEDRKQLLEEFISLVSDSNV